MRTRLALLLCAAMLLVAPSLRADDDDDDSAADDDDSAETDPDDAATYGWLCGVGAEGALPAAPMLLLAGVGLIGRREGQRA
jgi:hypothetical protein